MQIHSAAVVFCRIVNRSVARFPGLVVSDCLIHLFFDLTHDWVRCFDSLRISQIPRHLKGSCADFSGGSEATLLVQNAPVCCVAIDSEIGILNANSETFVIITRRCKVHSKVELICKFMWCGELNLAELMIHCAKNYSTDCTNGQNVCPELLIIKLQNVVNCVQCGCEHDRKE